MPKIIERKTNKASWSEESMRSAIRAVKEGNKIRATCRKYEVPYSSLRDRLKEGYYGARLGRKSVFTREQETEICEQLLNLSKMFFGLTPLQLRRAVFEFAETNQIPNRFNKDTRTAGKDWLYSFMSRQPNLSFRKPEATSLNRVTAFNKQEVSRFFENLEEVMSKYNFDPIRIYNMDETGITAVHKPAKIVGPKGQKQVGAITSLERGKTITVCCSMSAAGSFVPPMFIYPRVRMTSALERNGPPGSIYRCSKNGWINEELFRVWLEHFVKSTNASKDNPVLLVIDNHSSHSSLAIYHFCRDIGIVMLSIPPHSSHRLQPLDLTFFGPLKKSYSFECELFMKTNPYLRITNTDVPGLFTKAYLKVAVAEKAVNGFRTAGIFPMNPGVFDEYDFAPETPNGGLDVDGTNESSNGDTRRPLAEKQIIPADIQPTIRPVSAPRTVEPTAGCSGIQWKKNMKPTDKKDINISFSQISPSPSAPEKKKIIRRKKQRSQILTSTPMKEELEILEMKRKKRLEAQATGKGKDKGKCSKSGKEKMTKRKVFDDSSDEENVDLQDIVDDDELDDVEMSDNEIAGMEHRVEHGELCMICQEPGKNELWFRCTLCGKWAHADCTGADRPHGYICDFCMP